MKVFSYIKNLANKRSKIISDDFRKFGIGLMLAGVLGMALKSILTGGAVSIVIGMIFWITGLFLSQEDK